MKLDRRRLSTIIETRQARRVGVWLAAVQTRIIRTDEREFP
jgi:hypothetical protein